MSSSDAIVVKNLKKSYGKNPVLKGLNLTVKRGTMVALLGPNGAGKSVLVRLLTHEERALPLPDDASPVRVFGDDNWNVFELRPQLGIVSADLHQRFVSGNSEGRITGLAAVLSGFVATHGVLRYSAVTDEMRRRAQRPRGTDSLLVGARQHHADALGSIGPLEHDRPVGELRSEELLERADIRG